MDTTSVGMQEHRAPLPFAKLTEGKCFIVPAGRSKLSVRAMAYKWASEHGVILSVRETRQGLVVAHKGKRDPRPIAPRAKGLKRGEFTAALSRLAVGETYIATNAVMHARQRVMQYGMAKWWRFKVEAIGQGNHAVTRIS